MMAASCALAVGIAAYSDDAQTALRLVEIAELALCKARRLGKNRVNTDRPARRSTPAEAEGSGVTMSLRKALAALPDDRDTVIAARKVVTFFHRHAHDPVEAARVARATGLAPERTDPVIAALAEGGVLHCDGDPCSSGCRYDPDRVLALEVDRFMRATDSTSARLQSGVDRYRDRFGHS
jgi:hypothetical protein